MTKIFVTFPRVVLRFGVFRFYKEEQNHVTNVIVAISNCSTFSTNKDGYFLCDCVITSLYHLDII